MPLVGIFGDQQPCQISVPCTLLFSTLCFVSWSVRTVRAESVKSLVYKRLTTFAALASLTGARHIIKEGCEVGQVCFPLHKSLLTTQKHPVLSSWERASRIKHLCRDLRCHWPVIPQLLLCALPEDRRPMGLLQILRCVP